jgi:hypothetical protein
VFSQTCATPAVYEKLLAFSQLIRGIVHIKRLQRKRWTITETEPISTSVMKVVKTEGAHWRGSVRKCADWSHCLLETQTSTIYLRHQVLLAEYYKPMNLNTHLFLPPVFLFQFLGAYYSLFYSISLSFINSFSFWCHLNIGSLGDCLSFLVTKLLPFIIFYSVKLATELVFYLLLNEIQT